MIVREVEQYKDGVWRDFSKDRLLEQDGFVVDIERFPLDQEFNWKGNWYRVVELHQEVIIDSEFYPCEQRIEHE